jgi:hypothetical protein
MEHPQLLEKVAEMRRAAAIELAGRQRLRSRSRGVLFSSGCLRRLRSWIAARGNRAARPATHDVGAALAPEDASPSLSH